VEGGPPDQRPVSRRDVVQLVLIGVVASIVGVVLALVIDWFPDQAAGSSGDIDTLWDVLLIVSVPIFVLVMTVAIYSVVKFRAKPGEMGDGPPIHGNTKLEIVWVTIPFLIVTTLAVYGWVVLEDIEEAHADEMVVNVTGQQFTWRFQYSKDVRSTELVLPEDRPVKFNVRSEDVIHSFWVPEFRLKTDAVPGITTHIRVTANRRGSWQVVCAELCGIGHSTMRVPVRVVAQDEFETWLSDQRRQAAESAGAAQ
jgi:cytochrome c oxidase subunit 2